MTEVSYRNVTTSKSRGSAERYIKMRLRGESKINIEDNNQSVTIKDGGLMEADQHSSYSLDVSRHLISHLLTLVGFGPFIEHY